MTFDAEQLDSFLLVGAAVTFLAILAVRVSSRAGLPSLMIYLLMGVALGEAGLGIQFEDAELAHALGFAALAIILAEGGLTTSWPEVRPAMRIGVSLATIGVAVSVTVVAVGSHYLLGLPWELAILLGAVTSPTDAAAVFSVLRALPLPKRLVGSLEAESGLNDAPTVVLVTLVSSGALQEQSVAEMVATISFELAIGVLAGLAIGFGGGVILRRIALSASGLYPIAVLCLAFLAYAGAAAVHGSGFAAIYVAALVLGNGECRTLGLALLRGGDRLAGADRPVRDARAAAVAGSDHPRDRRPGYGGGTDPHLRRPAALGADQLARPAAAVGD